MAQQQDNSHVPPPADRPSRPQSYQAPTSPPTRSQHDTSRPRASSSFSPERRARQQQQPAISNAVNSAFTQNDASAQVDPDLVALITQQVIDSLKLSGVHPPPQAPATEYARDPALQDDITPPSPEKANASIPQYTSPSQAEAQTLDGSTDHPSVYPPPPSHHEPLRPEQATESSRPDPPARAPTDDTTPLERIWKPLFDSHGNPTERLGQFLRGLAIHIIEDFDPPKSIVISPQKMLKFYEAVKLHEEIFPWSSLFGGRMTNSSLSHVYRDLMCEHHFIQFAPREKPTVPALTPAGFETWMTYLIRAYPELEYQRFTKAVLNMPISNADDRKERFPKELSRRLFPSESNLELLLDLEDALLADPVIELTPFGKEQQKAIADLSSTANTAPRNSHDPSYTGRKESSDSPPSDTRNPPPPIVTEPSSKPIPIPPPPSKNPPKSPTERKPFSSNSSESALDELQSSSSIERQRKPYYATPGGGKVYSDNEIPKDSTHEESRQFRANSNAPSARSVIDSNSDYGVPPRYRTGSVPSNSGPPPPRQSSPTLNAAHSYYHRSEAGYVPGSHGNSGPSLHPRDIDDNALRQTVSWNEYPTNDRMEYPPPPRDYPLPPPPPRDYDDELLRRHTHHPAHPSSHPSRY